MDQIELSNKMAKTSKRRRSEGIEGDDEDKEEPLLKRPKKSNEDDETLGITASNAKDSTEIVVTSATSTLAIEEQYKALPGADEGDLIVRQTDTSSLVVADTDLIPPSLDLSQPPQTPQRDKSSEEPPTTSRRVRFSAPSVKYIPTRHEDKKAQAHDIPVQVHVIRKPPSGWRDYIESLICILCFCMILCPGFLFRQPPERPRSAPPSSPLMDHLLQPTHFKPEVSKRANITLREFLSHPDGFDLAMAPSFFGYFGYFGSLAAWDEAISTETFNVLGNESIRSVAGASSGAMSAILLAADVKPFDAIQFCSKITLSEFADFPGLLTIFKGNKFQDLMETFMRSIKPNSTLQLEDSYIPVAVSGFDLQSFSGKLLNRGSMARAARASACFPFLFQPVGWVDGKENYLFVDGGIQDPSGLEGLAAFPGSEKRRIINMVVGKFLGNIPGPTNMPKGVDASAVLSISVQNLPQCGPWAMENGPLAAEGARRAMLAALDLPIYHGNEPGHYELHIDASTFVPSTEDE